MDSNTIFPMLQPSYNEYNGKNCTRDKLEEKKTKIWPRTRSRTLRRESVELREAGVVSPGGVPFRDTAWATPRAAACFWMSLSSRPPPLPSILFFSVIDNPPAGLVGMGQYPESASPLALMPHSGSPSLDDPRLTLLYCTRGNEQIERGKSLLTAISNNIWCFKLRSRSASRSFMNLRGPAQGGSHIRGHDLRCEAPIDRVRLRKSAGTLVLCQRALPDQTSWRGSRLLRERSENQATIHVRSTAGIWKAVAVKVYYACHGGNFIVLLCPAGEEDPRI